MPRPPSVADDVPVQVGSPRNCEKALEAGVDLICAQGTEGGGHTGEIGTSVLVPQCVDLCRKAISPLTGEPVIVLGAGGIYDGLCNWRSMPPIVAPTCDAQAAAFRWLSRWGRSVLAATAPAVAER